MGQDDNIATFRGMSVQEDETEPMKSAKITPMGYQRFGKPAGATALYTSASQLNNSQNDQSSFMVAPSEGGNPKTMRPSPFAR